jgi:hypothetical protein
MLSRKERGHYRLPLSQPPQAVVAYILDGVIVPAVRYPAPLPPDLEPWYAYTVDGGHVIVCALWQHYRPGADLTRQLVPIPVRTVLRGYAVLDGVIVVEAAYSDAQGVITPPEDDEF